MADASPTPPSPPDPPRPGVEPHPRGPRLSRLAVAGLVLALIPFCPPAGLFGSLLGLAALIQIRREPRRYAGQRIALAAIFIGALLALIWTLAIETIAERQQRAENELIASLLEETIQTIQQGETPPPNVWATEPGVVPDPVLIDRFRDIAADCFGPLDRVKISFADQPDGVIVRVQPVSAVFFFERQSVVGSAKIRLSIQQGSLTPLAEIVELDLSGSGDCDPPALKTWPPPGDPDAPANSADQPPQPDASPPANRSPTND